MQTKSLLQSIVIKGFSLMFGLFLFIANANSVVVLQYHHISDETPPITSTSPKLFKQHMDYLKQNKFNVLTLESFIRQVENNQPFTEKSILITFDDGYRSIYDVAFPVLKKHNFPFTVFVNTQPLQQQLDQFMTWKELQEIIDFGGAIANHSVSHPHMIRRNQKQDSGSKFRSNKEEIVAAEKLISNNLTKFHRVFAYPYGEFDNQVKSTLQSLGYIAFGQHSGAVGHLSDKLALPRFPFGGRFGKMEDFILKVHSRPLEVMNVVLMDQTGEILNSQLVPNEVELVQLYLKLSEAHQSLSINCFASDGSQLKSTKHRRGFIFTMQNALAEGRGRINCTAPTGQEGAFYWYSQPLIKADESGDFYQ